MQRIPMLVLLVAMVAVPACAPTHQSTPSMQLPVVPNPEKRLHVLETRLHLSEEQATAIRPILEDEYAKKTKLIKEIESDSTRDRRQELEDLEWSVIKQLSHHLDRTQLNAYCNLLDEEAKAQQQKTGPGQGGPGGSSGGPGGGGGGPGGGGGGPGGGGGGMGMPGGGGY